MLPRVSYALACLVLGAAGCEGTLVDLTPHDDLPATLADLSVVDGPPQAPGIYFDPDIQKDLDQKGCSGASPCHAVTNPKMTMMPSTKVALMATYQQLRTACTTGDCTSGGANALLLRKNLAGSGLTHGGGTPFTTTDPTYQRWLAWINAGAPFAPAGDM